MSICPECIKKVGKNIYFVTENTSTHNPYFASWLVFWKLHTRNREWSKLYLLSKYYSEYFPHFFPNNFDLDNFGISYKPPNASEPYNKCSKLIVKCLQLHENSVINDTKETLLNKITLESPSELENF